MNQTLTQHVPYMPFSIALLLSVLLSACGGGGGGGSGGGSSSKNISRYCADGITPDLMTTSEQGQVYDILKPFDVPAGIELVCLHFTQEGGTSTQDGTSWENAYAARSLKAVIDDIGDASASKVYALLLAAGTYKPVVAVDSDLVTEEERQQAFNLKNHVAIIGGWEGIDDYTHSVAANISILSGNIGSDDGDDDSQADNSYHVVSGSSGISATAILYGLSIRDGNANHETDSDHQKGGGLYLVGASPTISHSTISGNSAGEDGGGLYSQDSSPTISHSTISDNGASAGGGLLLQDSSPIISHSTISDNSAGVGGGFYLHQSSPTIRYSTISDNNSKGDGAGLHLEESSPNISYSTISGNVSSDGVGGGLYASSSLPTISYSTISGNRAPEHEGGGMLLSGSSPTISACTISSNSAVSGGGLSLHRSSPTISHSTLLNNDATYGKAVYQNNNDMNKQPQLFNNIIWGAESGLVYVSNDSSGGAESLLLRHTVLQSGVDGIVHSDTTDNTAAVTIDAYNVITGDPDFSTNGLYDNGGAVETVAIEFGSSAINQGLYLYRMPSPNSAALVGLWVYAKANENNWYYCTATQGKNCYTDLMDVNDDEVDGVALPNGYVVLTIPEMDDWHYCTDAGTTCFTDPADVGKSAATSKKVPDGYVEISATDARGYARSGAPDLGAYEYEGTAP